MESNQGVVGTKLSWFAVVVVVLGILSAWAAFNGVFGVEYSMCFYVPDIFLSIAATRDIERNNKKGMSLIILGLIIGAIPLFFLIFGLLIRVTSTHYY